MNISRATIQQHLRDLADLKLAAKCFHLWHITEEGKAIVGGRFSSWGTRKGGRLLPGQWYYDRAHNIKIKCEILAQPKTLEWLRGWKKNDQLKNNIFYTRRFGDIIITYTGKSLIFQIPPIKFRDSNHALAEAGHIGMALMQRMENETEGLKLGGMEKTAQVISQHHAIPNHPYARFLQEHGISYKDELIDIDASEDPELEFTDCDASHEHYLDYTDVVKQYIRGDAMKPKELTEAVLVTQKQLNQLTIGLDLIATFLRAQMAASVRENRQRESAVPTYIG